MNMVLLQGVKIDAGFYCEQCRRMVKDTFPEHAKHSLSAASVIVGEREVERPVQKKHFMWSVE